MSAAALLSELRRRDIQLSAEGSELRCSAPAGALTPELREALRRHKGDLLHLIASAQALTTQERAIVPLQSKGERTPVFGVAGHNGDVFCYRALAQALGPQQPFYGLQPPGADGQTAPLASVEALAAYFASQIRAFRPEGDLIVAGFCAGGAVAFELARQLAAGGRMPAFVALFGAPYPDYFSRRGTLPERLRRALERAHKHARALLLRSPRQWRGYVAGELGERRARLQRQRLAAADPVLALREKVESTTLAAVRAYVPRPFAGRLCLLLAGASWERSGVEALRWERLAAQCDVLRGPDASTGSDMLRTHAAAFAELFRRC